MIIDIDPTVDFACKMLLGHPEHPRITVHFLNAVLRPVSPIRSVQILNPIVGREFETDKLSILDILATDATGRMFNIEVQRSLPPWLPERLTYYAATQLVSQIGEGDSYRLLRPSIGICILDAVLLRGIPAYHNEFQLRTANGLLLTGCLKIHLLELPKYALPSNNWEIREPLDQWAYFFRQARSSSPEELVRRLPDPVFAEATGVLAMIARSPEEKRLYEARVKMERDVRTHLEDALEQGLQQGKIEGKIEGKIQTLQEILEIPVSSDEELQAKSLADLRAMAGELQQALRERRRS